MSPSIENPYLHCSTGFSLSLLHSALNNEAERADWDRQNTFIMRDVQGIPELLPDGDKATKELSAINKEMEVIGNLLAKCAFCHGSYNMWNTSTEAVELPCPLESTDEWALLSQVVKLRNSKLSTREG